MRIKGKSLKDIANYLKGQKSGRVVKRTGKVIKKGWKSLVDMFHDPFYMGILIQAGEPVDLRKAYGFVPMVSEDEYNAVQELSHRRINPYNTHHTFYPFKTMVRCFYCGHSMFAGASSGRTKRYLYYRCDTPNCNRKKRSIRGKVILDYIYNFFKKNFKLTKSDYDLYESQLIKLTDTKRTEINTQIRSREGYLKNIKRDIEQTSYGIIRLPQDSRAFKENSAKIAGLETEEERIKTEITELRNQLTDPNKVKLSLEQFLNLVKNAETISQSADYVKKDALCRLIFLNFTVDDKKVLSHQLKQPFYAMLKTHQDLSSGSVSKTVDASIT